MTITNAIYKDYVAQSPVRSTTFWLMTGTCLLTVAFGIKVGLAHWDKLPGGHVSFAVAMAVMPLPWIHAWLERTRLSSFLLSRSARIPELTDDEKEILGSAAGASFNAITAAYLTIGALLSVIHLALRG